MISIITATYNRANLLPNLYNSILKNKKYNQNLEWIIVDDGSKDDTEKIVKGWIKENKINIKYFKQNNQGKMAAINNYISEVSNELVIEIDSDDYLEDNAFEIILKSYPLIKENSNCYGILFKGFLIGNQEQKSFPIKNQIIKLFDLYYKKGFNLDAKIVFKSDIRKKYKYILEHSERFITEARTYYKMDRDYEGLYVVDESIFYYEYQEDGYSKNIDKIFKENPYGYYEYFKECFLMDFKNMSLKNRLYFIKQFILFGCLTNRSKVNVIKDCKGLYNKILITILVIPGFIVTNNRFNK